MKLQDLIVIMYHKGQLSEGKAASLIGVDRLSLRTMRDALITPSDDKSEKIYSTRGLIEYLENALDNGYDELGATTACPGRLEGWAKMLMSVRWYLPWLSCSRITPPVKLAVGRHAENRKIAWQGIK